MKNELLTVERVREVLNYDPLTGVFTWRIRMGANVLAGSVAGSLEKGYIRIKIDRIRYFAHRLAWLWMTGKWPDDEVDHRDTDRSNNRWRNLRDVTRVINGQNRRAPDKGNTSGFLGVSWSRRAKKWRASIKAGGVNIHVGLFDSPEVAHAAYLKEKRLRHQGNTL